MQNSQDVQQDAKWLFDDFMEELLESGDYEPDSPEIYRACMDSLEDGELIERVFSDYAPQRDEYFMMDTDYPEGGMPPYYQACMDFWASDTGKYIKDVVDTAWEMANDKMAAAAAA